MVTSVLVCIGHGLCEVFHWMGGSVTGAMELGEHRTYPLRSRIDSQGCMGDKHVRLELGGTIFDSIRNFLRNHNS